MQPQTNAIPFEPAFHAGPRIARPRRLFPLAARMLEVFRQRHRLAKLSDHQLADMGITSEEARTEAARPFWDLPRDRSAK